MEHILFLSLQQKFNSSLLGDLKIGSILLVEGFVSDFATLCRQNQSGRPSETIIMLKSDQEIEDVRSQSSLSRNQSRTERNRSNQPFSQGRNVFFRESAVNVMSRVQFSEPDQNGADDQQYYD